MDPFTLMVGVVSVVGVVASIMFEVRRMRNEQRKNTNTPVAPYLPDDPRVTKELEPVKRHVDQGQYQKALAELAETYPNENIGQDPYLKAIRALLESENLLYLGSQEVFSSLRDIICLVEATKPRDDFQVRQAEHILGRAHNDIGHFFWSTQDYGNSVREYLLALPHLQCSGSATAYAHSVKNLSYIYALLGKVTVAEILCLDALSTFQSINDSEGTGLSLNTLGLIYTAGRQYEIGRAQCENALKIFESISRPREIGLASMALGYSIRRLGSRDLYATTDRIGFFRDAKRYATQSVEIFSKEIKEPAQLVEAQAELGCVYRDWAGFYRHTGTFLEEVEKLETDALGHLQSALELSVRLGTTVKRVDILEDIAHIYLHQNNSKMALQTIEESESLVPKEYFIQSTSGLPSVFGAVTPYWSVLGKIHLAKGHIAFGEGQKKDAARLYVLSSAYFSAYAETSQSLDDAIRSVYARIRGLPYDELTSWRQEASQQENKHNVGKTRLMSVLDETLGPLSAQITND